MSARSGPLVVVGDVLLDVDVLTRAERLVPDAAAPVLEEQERHYRPGGAALAATLAARDTGAAVVLVAPLPDDEAGVRLRALLPPAVQVVALPCHGETPVKTRLRARGHTVARLDAGWGGVQLTGLPAGLRELLAGAAAVLVSDYGVGTTRDARLRALLAETAHHLPTVWDPHPRGATPVAAVAVVTPNAAEAAAASGIAGGGVGALRRAAETLLRRWSARSVAVTLGERGALLSVGNGASEIFPAPAVSAGDPCGAGDCFAAALAAALTARAVASEAVAHAVAAASAFVAAGGAANLPEMISGKSAKSGRFSRDQHGSALELAAAVRARGGTVVATGGCFDLLHPGHIATLAAARSLGDCLIVCLNSDTSVRRLKGAHRPLQPAADRARVLSSLRDVDAVAVFDEDTPSAVLNTLRPDIWVKGGDYAGAELPEAALLRQWDGEVVTVPYLSGRSTSGLVGLARR